MTRLQLLKNILDPIPTQLGGLGERCKLPQRGLGGVPAAKNFSAFWTELKPSGAT